VTAPTPSAVDGHPSDTAARRLLLQAESRVAVDPAAARADARTLIDGLRTDAECELLGRAWRVVGMSHGHEREPLEAVGALERARGVFARGALTRWEGIVTCDLATMHGNQLGRTALAIELFEQALRLAAAAGHPEDEGRALSLLGALLGRLERYDDAERLLRRAVDLLGDCRDTVARMVAVNNLGYLLLLRGRYPEARAALEYPLAQDPDAYASLDAMPARMSLALARAHMGETEAALAELRASEPLLREAHVYNRIDHAQTLGRIHLLAGRPAQAMTALRSALALARESGQGAAEVECLHHLTQAAERAGDLAAALEAERALRAAERRQFDEHSAARLRTLEAALQLEAAERQNRALETVREHLAAQIQERTAELRAEVEERRRAEQRAEYLAQSDWLTDLPNRRAFEAALPGYVQRAVDGRRLGLCFLDLDRFKSINDLHGHETGDAVLRDTAERLAALAPAGSLVARHGGDEFVLMVVADSAREIERVAESIVEAFAAPATIRGAPLPVGCSVGVAIVPDDVRDATTLLRRADHALRTAKRQGRGRWVRLASDSWADVERRARLEADLAGAASRGEMSLVFEPQWRLGDGTLAGVEALLRWQHPVLGTVPPDLFVPLAEESGQMRALGQWVLGEALAAAGRIDAALAAPRWSMAINVSLQQLLAPDFGEAAVAAARAAGWPFERLQFEITESIQMDRQAPVLANIRALHARGASFALDDFGSGFASFSQLQQLQFAKLKMDRSIVHAMTAGAASRSMARAIAALARALHMRASAEGVETEAQLDCLRAEGFDEGQGFLLARPVEEAQLPSVAGRTPALLRPTAAPTAAG